MNIETLNEVVNCFEELVNKSGFSRDLTDSINSMGANQGNIVNLRNIADKIKNHLEMIYSSQLPDLLILLFPEKTHVPFTNENYLEKLQLIIENATINANQFFSEINTFLTNLNSKVQNNIKRSNDIKTFIKPYMDIAVKTTTEKNNAMVAIIYKDKKVITNLNEFSKSLSRLQRTINLYHEILKSASPSDIEIVEVQNGSIDIIVNFDIDIALNLVDLFKIGFKCYLAYLSYKKLIGPIVETFMGNKKLETGETEREKDLLENIGEAIKVKIREQHKLAITTDEKIDKNITKKVEQVSKLVAAHIINENDIKLLALPVDENKSVDEREETIAELRTLSTNIHNELKNIPEHELVKLIEYYGKNDNTEQ